MYFLDSAWIEVNPINEVHINDRAKTLISSRVDLVTGDVRAAWLLKAISCIDLTTLAGT